ncbi:hypothetical protein [Streptomyces sp. NPDC003032]
MGDRLAGVPAALRDPDEQPLADNVLRFHVRDEEIVICFETEEPRS